MSVTYQGILNGVVSAFEEVGAAFNVMSPVPLSRTSVKAKAGPAAKVTATLVSLSANQQGAGASHGDSKTQGALVFMLSPSKADDHVALDSLGELFDTGHRALLKLDGKNGLRVGSVNTLATPKGIQFTAALVYGAGIQVDAPDALAGRG